MLRAKAIPYKDLARPKSPKDEDYDPYMRIAAAVVALAINDFRAICQHLENVTDIDDRADYIARLNEIHAELIDDHNPYVLLLADRAGKINSTLQKFWEESNAKRYTGDRKSRDRRTREADVRANRTA
jgi:hypothetical protein